MALNIKNDAVERLVADVAAVTGETKTEAVRRALAERLERLRIRASMDRGARLSRFLREEARPSIPAHQRGVRLSKAEEEAILGFGPEGV